MAEPELSGLGVMTSIPGRNRSSQSLMFFGLPARTTNVTTDPNGMPLVASASQSLSTLPALTRRAMSGSTEKFTRSAGLPSATPRDWSADAPYEVITWTPRPCSEALNAGITALQPGSGTA
ncbi:Uncharacterised protein [Mycobacterium tuberculosis]|uniref:Uncharacterized protein n=3 Tax=Mycobacterium tuberculosis TaxID=1773 RepID=A0A0U0QWB6_MYCTX|nr:Uncharacterised protein [Mycobacterium tuberculosis]COX29071.1 Uncharacterised protein [Mycobacterium tuberculosis]COX96225.1 Uncharacterised protein [Mycobacterium tuberculosis]COZ15560.1 Uncharacterised protein [Mycobacterium tuberculosis]